eukprot:TRINITY_DN27932_c0_g1_i2.p1 TRINITY_DN27932_c0_g1~~TRINITY_DN27932_c0_g1_i2.p1  ORF type:complete len:243 (-),score=57.61 TRINITY_DN27932_c0_g1_i2:306-1034(-)
MLPGPNHEMDIRWHWLDDDFADCIDDAFHDDVHLLVVTDCCHSETLADVDTHSWGSRRICHISACKDDEESTDTGLGGVLTRAIERAVRELAFKKGNKDYTLQEAWKKIYKHARWLETEQEPSMMCSPALDPSNSAWPLPQAWWNNMPGTALFKIRQEIEQLRLDRKAWKYDREKQASIDEQGLKLLLKYEDAAGHRSLETRVPELESTVTAGRQLLPAGQGRPVVVIPAPTVLRRPTVQPP